MADTKISNLTALAGASIATDDAVAIVDTSATETKKTTMADLSLRTETLTNKTINLASNTLTGTTAEFNAALSDANFATGGGTVTGASSGTNTGDQTSIVGITGTMAQFDTAVSDGNIVYQGQALGTPSSGVATNLTGTASGLTAGTVTTNANLTGHVTSVGNAAVLGSFTLSQLNTALSDADVATLAGTEELDNKTLDSSVGKGTWTASGTWTLPAFTLGGNITMGENTELLLDSALSADGKYCGIVRDGTAGTTLAFGDLIYLAAADSRWELADADAASTSGDVLLGMCVLAAAADGSATKILFYGLIRADAAFPALTIGAPAYVSTTAGDIQIAQPSGTDDVIRRVGFAWTADELLFNPSNDYITHT